MKTILLAFDVHNPKWGILSQEWESQESIEFLKKTCEELGYKVFFANNPLEWIHCIAEHKHQLDDFFIWNGVEGFGSRNRESYIPSLAEAMGIAHSGSDALSQAITLDKKLTKEQCRILGIPVLPDYLWRQNEELTQEIWNHFPCFLKPNGEGSSLGISSDNRVNKFEEIFEKGKELHQTFPELLIEPFLEGRELTIGLLGCYPNFSVSSAAFVDYEGIVYSEEIKTKDRMPESLDFLVPDALERSMKMYSSQIAFHLKLSGYARLDFRLDKDGNLFLLEINCTPGLSVFYSTYPKLWKDLTYKELIQKIIEAGLQDFKSNKRFSYGKKMRQTFDH